MTHRGPFQPLPFCDSVMLASTVLQWLCRAWAASVRSRFAAAESGKAELLHGAAVWFS